MVRKRCHVKSLSLKPTLLYLILSSQANASHFWLNEGWTTYIERVLLQVLYSPAERGFSFVIGSKALNDSLKKYEDRPKYQRLAISFEKGEDPDDAYSSIPYEKGANFILHLGEQLNLHFILGFEHAYCFLSYRTHFRRS
jgi:leukotriene-A4 hydrolase